MRIENFKGHYIEAAAKIKLSQFVSLLQSHEILITLTNSISQLYERRRFCLGPVKILIWFEIHLLYVHYYSTMLLINRTQDCVNKGCRRVIIVFLSPCRQLCMFVGFLCFITEKQHWANFE